MKIIKILITVLLSFAIIISTVECNICSFEDGNNSSVNSSVSETTDSKMVWIPRTGSKYHTRSNCSNMKKPLRVTRQEAENRGYEPCKNCY